MDEKAAKWFSYVIAFLAPGFVGLWALGYHVEEIRGQLGSSQAAGTEVGGFLFVVLASVGLGVFLSGVRYFLFDRFLFGWVGQYMPLLHVPPRVPDALEVARLQEKANEAFQELNEQFYRFYQFYSNTAVALALSFGAWLLAGAQRKLSPVLLVFGLHHRRRGCADRKRTRFHHQLPQQEGRSSGATVRSEASVDDKRDRESRTTPARPPEPKKPRTGSGPARHARPPRPQPPKKGTR